MPAGRPPKTGFVKPTQNIVTSMMKEGVGEFTHTAYLSKDASDAAKQYLIKLGVIDASRKTP